MFKKMTMLAMAVAALVAFAAPAAANAEGLITDSNGSPIPEGGVLHAVSTNSTTTTALGTLECEEVTLNATVETNETETALASGEVSTKNCTRTGGEKITIAEPVLTKLHLVTGGTSSATFDYTAVLANGALKCKFSGTVDVTWVTNSDQLDVEGTLAGTSPSPCPSSGNFKGSFTVTYKGQPVSFM